MTGPRWEEAGCCMRPDGPLDRGRRCHGVRCVPPAASCSGPGTVRPGVRRHHLTSRRASTTLPPRSPSLIVQNTTSSPSRAASSSTAPWVPPTGEAPEPGRQRAPGLLNSVDHSIAFRTSGSIAISHLGSYGALTGKSRGSGAGDWLHLRHHPHTCSMGLSSQRCRRFGQSVRRSADDCGWDFTDARASIVLPGARD